MKSGITTASHAVLLAMAGWAITVSSASAATDPGVRGGDPGAGDPVPGLTDDQKTLFLDGQKTFAEVDAVGDGLGPRFNLDSCLGCHSFPVHGGSAPPANPQVKVALASGAKNTLPPFITANGPVREARFKFLPNGQRDGGVHSLFVISGRVDSTGSAATCNAAQEDFAGQFARGNVSFRIPTPTYGLGLVENIPDTTLTANLAANAGQKAALGISGHLNTNGNDGRIARFGWKAQNVSLLLFSGEAYNVEMGITNELFPTERDLNANCQTKTTPNDTSGAEGIADADATLSDIEKFALYMRLLGAPIPSTTAPGGAASITHGKQVFNSVGCSMCHTPTLTTATTTVKALGNQQANLYSDLALHHMGPGLADNVIQGAAGPDEFRTAPLWGVGQRVFFLHDGRTKDLLQAIQLHASGGGVRPNTADVASTDATANWGGWNTTPPSEANRVIANFNNLPDASKQDLVNFLRSL
jgi:Di-haem oxidoreductase, putative peroxidase